MENALSWVLSWVNSGVAILVVIGLCLFFHEAGHFLAAKATRIGAYEFAMGFGPVLWRRKWGETVYALRLIPFGGFVRIAGMEPGERDLPGGLYSRPRWQALVVFAAGTFMNVVLAVLVYWAINVFSGLPAPDSRDVIIRDVFQGGAARAAGIRPGDKIVGVGGSRLCTEVKQVAPGSVGEKMGLRAGSRVFQIGDQPVATPGQFLQLLRSATGSGQKVWAINGAARGMEDAMLALKAPAPEALTEIPAALDEGTAAGNARRVLGVTFKPLDQFAVHRFISTSAGKTVTVALLRGDGTADVALTPAPDQDRLEMVDNQGKLITPHRTVGRVGIVLGPELTRAGVFEGLWLALKQSAAAVATVVLSIKAMIMGKIAAEPTGPIGIMAMTAETAKLGWASVLGLCGLVSANLAVINLVPIPPFDGAHIVLLGLEAVLRRRVDHRLEMIARVAGLVIVINLFLILAFKDISNLIRYGTY